jgi:hypothetical protein
LQCQGLNCLTLKSSIQNEFPYAESIILSYFFCLVAKSAMLITSKVVYYEKSVLVLLVNFVKHFDCGFERRLVRSFGSFSHKFRK